MSRIDGRKSNQLRPVKITKHFIKYPAGSCLIEMGNTKVICAATVEEDVPRWMKNKKEGGGWISSEYAMIPAATSERTQREATRGKLGGRTHEIQRLVGRALRAACDLKLIGPRTIWIDCDVIQADGGTRTASITGGFIALKLALMELVKRRALPQLPRMHNIAAVSVGIVGGAPMLDLCYEEDSSADVDMNVVMTSEGKFVEVQGTAEHSSFGEQDLHRMLTLAKKGIKELITTQNRVTGESD
jgi:ribonuclease PH